MSTRGLASLTCRSLAIALGIVLAGAVPAGAIVIGPVAPPVKVTLPAGKSMVATFVRGDANADQRTDISDPLSILGCLFSGGACPGCRDAADANDDGSLDMSDVVYLLNFLFLTGAPPGAPFDACDADSTSDGLGCESYPCAREYPIGTTWTRLDLPADTLEAGKAFAYVAARGGRVVWQDGYDVGGRTYFAVIFEKTAPTAAAHFSGLTAAELDARIGEHLGRGWSVRQLDSYRTAEGIRHCVIFEGVPRRSQVIYRELTEQEHQARAAELTAQGYRPVNVSCVLPSSGAGGLGIRPLFPAPPQPRYTAHWDAEDVGPWVLATNLSPSLLEDELRLQRSRGLQLASLSAFNFMSHVGFTAIFNSKLTTHWAAFQDKDEAACNDLHDYLAGGGFKLRFVTGYETDQGASFAACWTKNELVIGPAGANPIAPQE